MFYFLRWWHLLLVTYINCLSQVVTVTDTSTLKKRKIIAGTTIASGWCGSMSALYSVWYQNSELTKIHSFNDGNLWLQMDKAGHVYTAYHIGSLANDVFEWAGYSNERSAIYSGGIGFGFQTTLELLDGISSDWGFSWYDMSANLLGAGLFTSQELIWKEQRIIPKFSYHPTVYASIRPEVLGSSFGQRILKDYNGQTYWISFNPFQTIKSSRIPTWLCLSFGYSIHEKLKGDKEIYTDSKGVSYHSQREWLLSLDIDFSKLPAKRPLIKKILKQLNYVKLPFPTLLLRNGKLYGFPIYF
jgi:hypothetical protein